MIDIKALHQMVWEFRLYMDTHTIWKIPENQRTSCRFLVTEAAELADAYLRMIGGYARNNHKDLALPAELADVWLMALTAMGPEYVDLCLEMYDLDDQKLLIVGLKNRLDLGDAIDVLCEDVATLPRNYTGVGLRNVFYDCIIIGEILKVDAYTILEQKLQQIRSKYVTD